MMCMYMYVSVCMYICSEIIIISIGQLLRSGCADRFSDHESLLLYGGVVCHGLCDALLRRGADLCTDESLQVLLVFVFLLSS